MQVQVDATVISVHQSAESRPGQQMFIPLMHTQVSERLIPQAALAGMIAEAQAHAVVKDVDEGKEFGRGKRQRCVALDAAVMFLGCEVACL